jgi:hypothetical protein
VHAASYTPARHFAKGRSDPGFRAKLAIGAEPAVQAREAGFAFRAVVADSASGDQDGFRGELAGAGLPFVMALKPRRGIWAPVADAHTPVDAARALAWNGPDDPGDWQPVCPSRAGLQAGQGPDGLGWADFQVRSDAAIRRHQALICCAFSFCWAAWTALRRWWPAWSKAPPPPQLQALMTSLMAGCGLHLYIPN